MLTVAWAGRVDYQTAWDLQKELVSERERDADLNDHLLLLEHPPTYTLGRHGRMENLLLDEASRQKQGIALYRVDRGGDITYHGPGQLVGYPILYLERYYGRGIGRIRQYISGLETAIIQVLDEFGIEAGRLPKHRGVWIESPAGANKIAAVGIHVTAKGISSHGFALNVNPDLSYFQGIIPCGIIGHGVTSMAEQLGRSITIPEVLPLVNHAFSTLFKVEIELSGSWPEFLISAHSHMCTVATDGLLRMSS